MWRRLEEVLDVLDDMEGPDVEPEEPDLTKWGDDGGVGVTENERCIAGMWIVGRLTCLSLEAEDDSG